MPLTNPNKVVTEERLSEFYGQILPYMGGMPDVLANKFSKGDLYSTDEKMIGQWIDGKPLYQKVLTGTVSDTTHFNIPSGILIHNVFGSFYKSGSSPVTINPVYLYSGGSSWLSWWVDYPHNYIEFNMSSQHSNMSGEIVIQYTKTTDSPISIGSDTDYSTTEKIVGTWIDGKWIYQKTFTGSAIIDSTSWSTAFNIPKAGIAQIVGVFGTGSPSSGGQYWNLLAALDAHNTYIGFLAARDNSSCDVRTITLQYTKTS